MIALGLPRSSRDDTKKISLDEINSYCLEEGSIGKFSAINGGFCCQNLYPFPIQDTGKFICEDSKELSSNNLGLQIVKLDDQRVSKARVQLNLNSNLRKLDNKNIFAISSITQIKNKKRKKVGKKTKETKQIIEKCSNQIKNYINKIEKGQTSKLSKKQKRKLNSCYKYSNEVQKLSRNKNWTNWSYLAVIEILPTKIANNYLVKFSDLSGQCEKQYTTDETGSIEFEYFDYLNNSQINGFCHLDKIKEPKKVRQASIQYAVFGINSVGQDLKNADGPISIDQGFNNTNKKPEEDLDNVEKNLFPNNILPKNKYWDPDDIDLTCKKCERKGGECCDNGQCNPKNSGLMCCDNGYLIDPEQQCCKTCIEDWVCEGNVLWVKEGPCLPDGTGGSCDMYEREEVECPLLQVCNTKNPPACKWRWRK